MNKLKVLFLDRDGTIIKDKGYMYRPEDIEFIEGAVDALLRFQQKYLLVVVSNQSGVGRGFFDISACEAFNEIFLDKCSRAGIRIADSLYCPHGPNDGCECRKPRTKLVDDWLARAGVELDKEDSYVIGDKRSDLELASNLGIKGILVSDSEAHREGNDMVVSGLKELWR